MQHCLRHPKCLLILLLASAALNLVFVGYHTGRVFFKNKPTHEHVMHARIEGLTSLLPGTSRGMIESALDKKNEDVKALYKAMHDERRHIEKILASDSVDKDTLQQAFARLRQLHADSQKIYQDAFIDAVSDLPRHQRHLINRKIKRRHPMNQAAVKPPVEERED